ncbi:hypothetical protein SPRG_03333 [Saprolegnia parasitica CBS 223.65]|uniref:U-box domain-containing protein n=1 Tax=Saprolegnia parasitica (strain CBS 223.65) TaxID=695850 RepID=A0A067CS99_SAPPC|nr:hypothetical protein SPRG_03333 [Saprolegnia parasitica CBS 223.65]KDO32115.1 hypothetical protein SPRG_03333 [Saprolegnia parasitica CBS 223.65]|eukprot:XP_012197300.1 hypothetical protein SPRG_03333 [Saprolegnia parasitica CBS 223.65]
MTRHLDSFICPITHDVMVDPVVTVDGHSYERSAIAECQSRGMPGRPVTSPKTNLPLRSLQLIPNLAPKRSIEESPQRAAIVSWRFARCTGHVCDEMGCNKDELHC